MIILVKAVIISSTDGKIVKNVKALELDHQLTKRSGSKESEPRAALETSSTSLSGPRFLSAGPRTGLLNIMGRQRAWVAVCMVGGVYM